MKNLLRILKRHYYTYQAKHARSQAAKSEQIEREARFEAQAYKSRAIIADMNRMQS